MSSLTIRAIYTIQLHVKPTIIVIIFYDIILLKRKLLYFDSIPMAEAHVVYIFIL